MNPSRTLDLVLSFTDNASSGLKSAGSQVQEFEGVVGRTTSFIEDNWVKIGAGAAALGVGIEALGRKQAENTRNLANLGIVTGRTTGEMRDLARSLTNVTLPLDDVVTLLEAGARQGLETNEELADFVNMWDMVSDATGVAASTLAEQSMALRRVGIEAGDTESALDAFGFVTKNTMLDVDDLLNIIERRGREIETLGLNINQTAALMSIMQENTGASGRVLRQEFTRAVNDAEGDLSALLTTLGTTEDEFNSVTSSVTGHSSVIEDMAKNYEDSFTVMQRMQAFTADLALEYGGLLQAMTAMTPVLIALGPILGGLIKLKATLAGVTLAAVGPYLLIAAAVAALVTAGLYLWRNWEDIAHGFKLIWEDISAAFSVAVEFLKGLWGSFTNWFKQVWEMTGEGIVIAGQKAFSGLKSVFIDPITKAMDGVIALLERARALFSSLSDGAGNVVSGVRDRASGLLSSARSFVTRSVNDAIISPKGDIITTHPDDYIIATKTPGSLGGGNGVTVNVYGDVSGRDLIETVKRGIIGELKHNIKLTNTAY